MTTTLAPLPDTEATAPLPFPSAQENMPSDVHFKLCARFVVALNGHSDVIEPTDAGRLTRLEVNADLALEGGQLRLDRNGQRIVTAVELRADLERVPPLLPKKK